MRKLGPVVGAVNQAASRQTLAQCTRNTQLTEQSGASDDGKDRDPTIFPLQATKIKADIHHSWG